MGFSFWALAILVAVVAAKPPRPHVVFVLSDDHGYLDASYRGLDQIPTPALDKICQDGITMRQMYSQPLCTPSRAAVMTGRYPIRYGFQRSILRTSEPRCLPLNETMMPLYFKELGYTTHHVGKWHLGFAASECIPFNRGFDSSYGFMWAEVDYWDRSMIDHDQPFYGWDIFDNDTHPYDTFGVYGQELWGSRVENIINEHDPDTPLFLYFATQAVHSGLEYQPLTAPAEYFTDQVNKIQDLRRRTYGAMTGAMDDNLDKLLKALEDNEMLDDTIVVYMSDNGGAVNGFENAAASNWPLRGGKFTAWEGGVRVHGCIKSELLDDKVKGTVSNQVMHAIDWLPTLVTAVGGDVDELAKKFDTELDGIDMWDNLNKAEGDPRGDGTVATLLNVDLSGMQQAAVRKGNYKIVTDNVRNSIYGNWYMPYGGLQNWYSFWNTTNPNFDEENELSYVSEDGTVKIYCGDIKDQVYCGGTSYCLYDVVNDPCERFDLSETEPEKFEEMKEILEDFTRQAAPPNNRDAIAKSNPAYYDGYWNPFITKEELLAAMYPGDFEPLEGVCTKDCAEQVASCESIPKVENGWHNGRNANLNTRVTYFCDEDYRVSGPNTIRCDEDGKWSPSVPECVEMEVDVEEREFTYDPSVEEAAEDEE